MYVQGSCGYGSRYPYAAKGAVRQRHGVDVQKTRCRWCINRPELPGSISAEDWNRNSTPEEQNQTSLHFPAVCPFFFFYLHREDVRVFSNLHTPELGISRTHIFYAEVPNALTQPAPLLRSNL